MLTLRNLVHTYSSRGLENRTVLNIDGFVVHPGEQILLRGISGSGKTTLMNILSGLLYPTTGEVVLGDQSLFSLPEARRDRFRAQNIGYVFQTHMLVANLSALENVEMPLVFAGIARRQRRRRTCELLAQVGLSDFAKNKPNQLSTGQRLRVAVARALVSDPTLLLADEPTAALDAESGETVLDLLQERAQQHNAILIVASHDPALDRRFDRVVDLVEGALHEKPIATDRRPPTKRTSIKSAHPTAHIPHNL